MTIFDWVDANPGKTVAIFLVAASLSLGSIAAMALLAVNAYQRHTALQSACEAQKMIYIDGECKAPAAVIKPKDSR